MVQEAEDRLDRLTTTSFDQIDDFCTSKCVINRFGSWEAAKFEAGVIEDVEKCPKCGKVLRQFGNHWRTSCGYPEIPDRKWNMFIGLLMGDASVQGDGYEEAKNANMRIYSSNKKFLEWLDGEMGVFTTNVNLNDTGGDRLLRNQKSGFDNRKEADYSDMYVLNTRAMPCFTELRVWYDSGKKKFPKSLELTKEVARMWFVSDGGLNWQGERYTNPTAQAEIASVNESERPEMLVSLFEDHGFNPTFDGTRLHFNSQTEDFLEWLGDPVPGYEYKWETKNRDRYKELYETAYN